MMAIFLLNSLIHIIKQKKYDIDSSGTVEDFNSYMDKLNMSQESINIIQAYMVHVLLHSHEQIPVVIFKGPPMSGKTTSIDAISELIGPISVTGKSLMQSEVKDFESALMSSWINVFDNVNRIPQRYQDTLCVASTGGTVSRKKLYTDNEMSTESILGPVLISTISNISLSEDLLTRTVWVHSDNPVDNPSTSLFTNSEVGKARAGLLKLASKVIEVNNSNVKTPKLKHRMPGFANTICSMSVIDKRWINLISEFQDSKKKDKMKSVPEWILKLCELKIEVEGNATEVVEKLEQRFPKDNIPGTRKIKSELSKYAEYFTMKNMKYETYTVSGSRRIKIRNI